ncbi:FkbM family methyltransferase [Roseiarcus fermentans]|uniref:FkbM family methyltransferase n=1 Tax=Roseiarcus fermentans TaxID=1473586 RepID=A0A366FID4_9HYPH|nr:FkbM family methyltransferase [Roseiarcus fermentans]RBP14347.1 FkbM family methyltransferase [Roseiarcus fermentans]
MYDLVGVVALVAVLCLLIIVLRRIQTMFLLINKENESMRAELSVTNAMLRRLDGDSQGLVSSLVRLSRNITDNHIGRSIDAAHINLENKLNRIVSSLDFIRTNFTTYLGDGVALSYLIGDIPLYVNCNDTGVAANVIIGGNYEPDNIAVLLSFLKPDSVFVDIGANLGVFSVIVGAYTERTAAKIYTFEPNPEIFELLKRSLAINGFAERVTAFPIALGETEGTLGLAIPVGVSGGATLLTDRQDIRDFDPDGTALRVVKVAVKRLDDVMPADFTCDLVKIDVEGKEAEAIEGMKGIIGRSDAIKMIIEKLDVRQEYTAKLWRKLTECGLSVYTINARSVLEEVSEFEAFSSFRGYILASKERAFESLERDRIAIWPEALFSPSRPAAEGRLDSSADRGDLLFYGPYWPLRAGLYEIVLDAEITGDIRIIITERKGHPVADCNIANNRGFFRVDQDLSQFECVGRARNGPASIALRRIALIRRG